MVMLLTARIGVSLLRNSRLSHESGVFTAMAMDFAHGVLYRPLIGPDGYGGTRYFPLQVILHGSLIHLGLKPIPAGYVLLLSSLLLLLASLYWLLRNLSVPPILALCMLPVALGTYSSGMAITMIRGDLMPAALDITALAIVAGIMKTGSASPVVRSATFPALTAGVIFGLTFLTKETTLFGVTASVIALWLTQQRVAAFIIAAISGTIGILGLVIVQIASHGNFLLNLRTCATGGSLGWGITHLPITIFKITVLNDPLGCALLIAGIAAMLLMPARARFSLPGLLLWLTGAVTLVLFLSPGIDKNHLIDLEIAAVVALAVYMSSGLKNGLITGRVVIGLLLVAELWVGWRALHADLSEHVAMYRHVWRTAIHDKSGSVVPGPVLTDYTLLPVLANQRPYMLDEYMIPVIAVHLPQIQTDIYDRLDRRFFSAVILKADPTKGYRLTVWGPDFTKHLNANYVYIHHEGNFTVYQRRGLDLAPLTQDAPPVATH
jgi:hypothetical protein